MVDLGATTVRRVGIILAMIRSRMVRRMEAAVRVRVGSGVGYRLGMLMAS